MAGFDTLAAMTFPRSGTGLDPASLGDRIAELPLWPFGRLRDLTHARIGIDYGLSGEAYRVRGTTAAGEAISLVVKLEKADAVSRAVAFHEALGDRLGRAVPACFGGLIDAAAATGLLILEDVAPAEQGDVLGDPGSDRLEAAILVFARLHALSVRAGGADHEASLPRWRAAPLARAAWASRLEVATARYPEVLSRPILARLADVPDRLGPAIERLQAGPASWIHSDAHLDNVLWRSDGSAVVVDWAGAAMGPPAIDASRFILEGPPAVSRSVARRDALLRAYRLAAPALPNELFVDAALVFVQGVVGWAGRTDVGEPSRRMADLRVNALGNIRAWLESDAG